MKVSFSPDIILCVWLSLKHQLTIWLTVSLLPDEYVISVPFNLARRPPLAFCCCCCFLQFQCWSDWRWLSCCYTCVLQPINGVISLALFPPGSVSSPPTLPISHDAGNCDGCFACQSTCRVVSLDSRRSSVVDPRSSLTMGVEHRDMPSGPASSVIFKPLLDVS